MSPELLGAGIGAGIGAAFMVGLSFGSGPCNLTCLPYLGPLMLGPAAQRPFYAALLPFMLGRLLGYISLGVLAALLGEVIKSGLSHPAIPLLVAGVTAWLALRLFLQSGRMQKGGCGQPKAPVAPMHGRARLIVTDATADQPEQSHSPAEPPRNWLQLLLLGMTLALNPCLPLLGLLAASAQSGSVVTG
ncbi:MAG: sulfite exporter TauE/SafE family protein, partial [Porticoccaceae bacterium]|nr:sulfite exporter TauE/SafE family protein [Porticoccaceae bacterium]